MRVPTLVISLLAAVPCAAAVQAATVVAPEAAVSGVIVTNTGTYKAQSVSAPSGAGQSWPTGTIGTASNWHFVSKTTEVAGEVGIQFGIEFRLEGQSGWRHRDIAHGAQVSPARNPQSEYGRYDAYRRYKLSQPEDRGALPARLWLRQCLGDRAGSVDGADLVSKPHAGRADLYGEQAGTRRSISQAPAPPGEQSLRRSYVPP